MASSSSSSNPFLFGFLSLVCCCCFFFFVTENKPFVSAIRKEHSELQHTHHHIALSSFFPSSSCNSPPQGASRKGSLEVVHKHGPCSELKQQVSSSASVKSPLILIPHSEILEQDKARVKAIQSKLWEADGRSTMSSEASDQTAAPAEAPLPAQSGEILGTGDYFVKVGLGTPARELSLIFDTGSDLTWTQCLPCPNSDSCYTQNEPIFDPSQSSSYSIIPCPSSQCSQLSSGNEQKCSGGGCSYTIKYGDKSITTGNLANETLTITPTHVVDNFLFGCGHDNKGSFTGTAGLLGLGRSPVSFVEQTSDMFHKIFSYCLPSLANDVGYLTFGSVPDSDNITYTPFSLMLQNSPFYAVDITGISVADASLSAALPSYHYVFHSGVIIDSGTVISRFPPAAYGPMRDAFRNAMSKYRMTDAVDFFDTCYDVSGHETVVVPKVTLSFGGGMNVDLDASGVVYALSETQVCLAFVANEHPSDITIIGNVQQRTFEVVYDVGAGKVGFRSGGCSGDSKFVTGASTGNLNHPNLIWMVQIYLICFFTFYFLF